MGTYQKGQGIEITDSFTLDGVATNPTALEYRVLGPDGALDTYTWPGSPEITNPAVGDFVLSLDPPDLPGEYHYDVDATETVIASRSGNFTVLADVTVAAMIGWAVPGPCSPWVDSNDVWACCGQPMTTTGEGSAETECAVDMSQYAMQASQILYELSGGQFSGACEKTVRPCSNRGCGWQVLSRGHIVEDPYYGSWMGSYWEGSIGQCGCQPMDRILLSGYPVRSIEEVLIDELYAVLETDNWRLDERRWLTRMADTNGDAQAWPSCQRMDLPDTDVGTFSVTYRYGQDPPITGLQAAAALGCEFYRSCTGGGECALPTGVSRMTRQGLTIDRTYFARDPMSGIWRTGMPTVDAFLNTYNSSGLQRRPTVWSPDGPHYARPVQHTFGGG